jgi:hypothetical protein
MVGASIFSSFRGWIDCNTGLVLEFQNRDDEQPCTPMVRLTVVRLIKTKLNGGL